MFLSPSRFDLGESLLITTLLGIPLGEPDGKTPTQPEDRIFLSMEVSGLVSSSNLSKSSSSLESVLV